jgi:hypothetical protein
MEFVAEEVKVAVQSQNTTIGEKWPPVPMVLPATFGGCANVKRNSFRSFIGQTE